MSCRVLGNCHGHSMAMTDFMDVAMGMLCLLLEIWSWSCHGHGHVIVKADVMAKAMVLEKLEQRLCSWAEK